MATATFTAAPTLARSLPAGWGYAGPGRGRGVAFAR